MQITIPQTSPMQIEVIQVTPFSSRALKECVAEIDEHYAIERKGERPGYVVKTFYADCDDGYVAFLFKKDGRVIGAACFRDSCYIQARMKCPEDVLPPLWTLQWARLEPSMRRQGILKATWSFFESYFGKFLVLNYGDFEEILPKWNLPAYRILSPKASQLNWMPPDVRRSEAKQRGNRGVWNFGKQSFSWGQEN